MGSGSTQSLSAERPMVPPSTEKIALLRSASERRWSLTTRSRSVLVPRLKKAPSVGHIMPASKLPDGTSPAMAVSHIFRIMFVNQGKVYEVYARKVSHGELFGFIEVEELVFGERSSVVLDPSEERIKGEFSGVKRTFLPMHSILRIDEVKKQGTPKITALESGANVAQFPVPLYSAPPGGEKK